jgi:hypothetical protein
LFVAFFIGSMIKVLGSAKLSKRLLVFMVPPFRIISLVGASIE